MRELHRARTKARERVFVQAFAMKDLVRAPTREFQRQRAGTSGSARRAARARRPRLAREDVARRARLPRKDL